VAVPSDNGSTARKLKIFLAYDVAARRSPLFPASADKGQRFL